MIIKTDEFGVNSKNPDVAEKARLAQITQAEVLGACCANEVLDGGVDGYFRPQGDMEYDVFIKFVLSFILTPKWLASNFRDKDLKGTVFKVYAILSILQIYPGRAELLEFDKLFDWSNNATYVSDTYKGLATSEPSLFPILCAYIQLAFNEGSGGKSWEESIDFSDEDKVLIYKFAAGIDAITSKQTKFEATEEFRKKPKVYRLTIAAEYNLERDVFSKTFPKDVQMLYKITRLGISDITGTRKLILDKKLIEIGKTSVKDKILSEKNATKKETLLTFVQQQVDIFYLNKASYRLPKGQ